MEIEVKDKEKRVNIWLTRAESQDQALLDSLKPLYKEYKAKKYLVAVFHSGNGNMKESIRDLLLYNKTRIRELEMEKEKQAADLKKQYFGPEGELFKKRNALMSPIQDEIYNAVKDVADQRGYQLVLDRASDTGIIFGSPKIDISSEILRKLGY